MPSGDGGRRGLRGLSLGMLRADIERLYSAAMFHDIGKARIPLAVLDKPGRLDDRERALIETHPAAGYDVLTGTLELPRKFSMRFAIITNISMAAAIPTGFVPGILPTSYGY